MSKKRKKVVDYMSEYSVCPFCGCIFRERELDVKDDGTAKCNDCGHKLYLQHVNGLHEVFSSYLDEYPIRTHYLRETTITYMKDWFRKNFIVKNESCYYDKAQVFVDKVWDCMCSSFEFDT